MRAAATAARIRSDPPFHALAPWWSGARSRDDAERLGLGYCLELRVNVELGQDASDVRPYSEWRNVQLRRDGRCVSTRGQQAEHLHLTARESIKNRLTVSIQATASPAPRERELDLARFNQRLSIRHLLDGLDDRIRSPRLG